ncbi:NUDIX domain [Trypanosoma vivax]|uniref:Putative NUDIX hydrolase n=1 Tax=Trypanosoma vivax (strain Y486) TaxID=1055687 RepID=G0UCK2_TRYVY|nr:putative NUDIX hydrolase [Trypanosoma vivax]KAH8608318.1 NUDIX domain [Trypanosoma vivax]CCC53562.1 putative NUDIX hydrolase [Trypanosoma vivax Y486]
MKNVYRRVDLKCIQECKYLRVCEAFYEPVTTDEKSKVDTGVDSTRRWELVQRTTRQTPIDVCRKTPVLTAVDSVEICAFLRRQGELFLILVAQYRPPLDNVVLEFPAGLVDPGEDIRVAALRELKEETGFTALPENIINISDPVCLEPGMSDSCCKFVRLLVDGDSDVNLNPCQQLDVGEDIQVVLIPLGLRDKVDINTPLQSVKDFINREKVGMHDIIVDSRLYMFLEGLSLSLPI